MTKRATFILIPILLSFFLLNLKAQEGIIQLYISPIDSIIKLNNIVVYKNIRYGAIPDSIENSSCDRILDLYLPEESDVKKTLPVLIFIHGGGFSSGDKWSNNDICSKIAKNGFVVVSINYRLTIKSLKAKGIIIPNNTSVGLPTNGKFQPRFQLAVKNASDDAIMALSWVKKNAIKYNFNLKSVSISGGSAGGMTALYTAYASGQKVLPIHSVIDFWGALENSKVIQKGAAPVLIYHGDEDKLVHVDFAFALKKRMDEINSTKSKLHILKGKGHAQYKLIADEKIDEIVNFLNEK